MNPQLVGEPAVAAFLQSVLRNLAGIRLMKPNYSTFLFYDPTQDLEKLKQTLVFFQGLVMDGEAKRLDDPAVDDWMDELKDLLYDAEDIFDDIRPSLWKDQVSNNFPLLEQFSHDIKDRFDQILARSQKLEEAAETLKLERGGKHAFWGDRWKVNLRTRETSSTVDISEIHGREEDKDDIVKRLLDVDAKQKKKYDVVCIVGMGGIGKTTLAQQVFNDPEVVKNFDLMSWVCISNDFDVARATKQLIEYSGGGCSIGDKQSLASLQKRLEEMTEKKKFLFVLDDVWSSSEWETMKRPFSKCANGSKILVTTRNIEIARKLGDKNPYQLQGLNHEKCMEIFKDKAFGDDDGEEEKFFLVEKIVIACRGVPLVVKVIGSMLEGADVEKWRAVSENTATWANTKDEILPAIRLSYYDLPASLKRCFEYLAVFPPDYRFYRGEVVRLWIADGLVEEEEGRRVEDIGKGYYNELKARSLIQEDDMMHDIVHHLATELSRKFCYKENSQVPPASVRHAYFDTLNAMHYDQFLAEARCLRTLLVGWVEDEYVLGDTIKSCKMMRACKMTSLGECLKDQWTHIRFLAIEQSSMRHLSNSLCVSDNLQFLELSDCSDLESLPEAICHLSQLQVLSLKYCPALIQLPKDIGKLRSLRKLDLRETSIVNLPESICALGQLQVLFLKRCNGLKQLPKDIGNLRSLRKLDLGETSIVNLPESICALGQLQDLSLKYCCGFKQLPKDIGNLRSLRKLDLELTSRVNLPESICALGQLQDLSLKYCHGFKQLPKDMGNLRSLRKLDLEATSIVNLPESICALGQLQVLNLNFCGNLTELPKDIGNLRSLQELDLRATAISSLPISILNIPGLQNLLLADKLLPLHIGSVAELKEVPSFYVGKVEEMGILEGHLVVAMDNIGSIEEANTADLKSMKNIRELEFRWNKPGNDEEMEVKIMEALEPHPALESLEFFNYGGDKFPGWILSTNICWSNLVKLNMEGLNKICEMTEMEFVLLKHLSIKQCPKLRKVLMATPKLESLSIVECGELEADCVHFLPSLLSDKPDLVSIISQLKRLNCAYNIFGYWFDKLKTANSKWENCWILKLSGGGTMFGSMPRGWPSMLESLQFMYIYDIAPGKFQILHYDDLSPFPKYLDFLCIKNCFIEKWRVHHSYMITADGKVKSDEVEQNDTKSSAE